MLNQQIENVRSEIIAEETFQRQMIDVFNKVLDPLREEVSELNAEIERLNVRLERLEYADEPLSDRELDDQDHEERSEAAAFWASWQHERDEQARNYSKFYRKNDVRKNEIKRLYRQLARLIHPDLARTATERAGREVAMRLANIAFEAGDREQLHRMVEMWTSASMPDPERDYDALSRMIAQREKEYQELRTQLHSLVRNKTARLARTSEQSRKKRMAAQQDELRREIAGLRLRRRRLLRAVNARRKQISSVAD